ncbi:MAG: SdrD B-like domain-containing protein, partial [Flavobacterium sp.]
MKLNQQKTSKWQKLLCFFMLFMLSVTAINAQVTGTVFRDFNGNGTRETEEPLVSGITVNAYNTAGTLCGTTTTSGTTAPNYSVTGCGTGQVRVEFVIPTSGNCVNSNLDFSSFVGTNNGTAVQFVNGNSTSVNFSLHNPNDYNKGAANTEVFIPAYVSGDPLVPGAAQNGTWFMNYPYNNTGERSATAATRTLNGAVIGSVWGVAYSKQANKVFTSAFLKRHTGLGALGTGGIYMLTPTATSFNVNQFYNLDANGHRTRAAAGAPAYG